MNPFARATLGSLALWSVVTAAVIALEPARDASEPGPVATGEAGPEGLEPFYRQDPDWTPCGTDLCAEIEVPIDYADPGGDRTSFRARLRPAVGESARTLVVNPGGPGGSGLEYLDSFADVAGDALLEDTDVVSFDPRGVASSSPLACVDGPAVTAVQETDPTPTSNAEVAALVGIYANLAESCLSVDPALATHVGSVQVARDLDVLRALLGEERLAFYGASYGSVIGLSYRSLFPATTGQMVIDSPVDLAASPLDRAVAQAASLQASFDAYLGDCLAAGCPWATSRETATTALLRLWSELDVAPLETSEGRVLTEASARVAVIAGLYNPGNREVLSEALERALNGEVDSLLEIADTYFGRVGEDRYSTNGSQVAIAIRCGDEPRRTTAEEVADRLDELVSVSPLFGAMTGWSVLECGAWPDPAEPVPSPPGADGGSLLVVGARLDPVTPVAWAESVSAQAGADELLVREGSGHTSLGQGDACVDARIVAHLRSEKAAGSASCEGSSG